MLLCRLLCWASFYIAQGRPRHPSGGHRGTAKGGRNRPPCCPAVPLALVLELALTQCPGPPRRPAFAVLLCRLLLTLCMQARGAKPQYSKGPRCSSRRSQGQQSLGFWTKRWTMGAKRVPEILQMDPISGQIGLPWDHLEATMGRNWTAWVNILPQVKSQVSYWTP